VNRPLINSFFIWIAIRQHSPHPIPAPFEQVSGKPGQSCATRRVGRLWL